MTAMSSSNHRKSNDSISDESRSRLATAPATTLKALRVASQGLIAGNTAYDLFSSSSAVGTRLPAVAPAAATGGGLACGSARCMQRRGCRDNSASSSTRSWKKQRQPPTDKYGPDELKGAASFVAVWPADGEGPDHRYGYWWGGARRDGRSVERHERSPRLMIHEARA